MLLRCVLRSVSRQTCWRLGVKYSDKQLKANGCVVNGSKMNINCNSNINGTATSFEEYVLQQNFKGNQIQHRRFSTAKCVTNRIEADSDDDQQKYEVNTLII